MTKKQFLEELRYALKGELPENEIDANVAYYNDYITESIQRGSTEEEIFNELGNPQWIARTIAASYEADRTYDGTVYEERIYEGKKDFYDKEGRKMTGKRKYQEKIVDYMIHGFPWYYKVAGIVILVMVLSVLYYIGIFITKIILQIAVPLLIIYIVWSIFIKKRHW